MQILCPRTWSWASTTWRWTIEKKRELGSEGVPEKDKVRGLPFRGAKAYNSTIAISFGVWTTIWAAEHNQQTEESRQTPHWNSVCMSWDGGRAVLPRVPCQAHSIPEFECHQLHTASSSSLLFVMTAPLVSELTSLRRPHSSLCCLFHCWLTRSRK